MKYLIKNKNVNRNLNQKYFLKKNRMLMTLFQLLVYHNFLEIPLKFLLIEGKFDLKYFCSIHLICYLKFFL